MANPTATTKFASVNLNKSYGQHSSSYGSNRNRASVNGGGGGGGGGGGMVVLSRPRSSHKPAGTKLSVPPPLNLPSLRKEHERSDSLGSAAGTAGAAGSGSGFRPPSSGIGWTKPATIALQEKQHLPADPPVMDGFSRGSSVYMPPSARSVTVGPAMALSAQPQSIAEKAVVLRGEDFPSLKAATLSSSSVTPHKPKEDFNNKHKQLGSDSLSTEQKDASGLSSLADVGNSLSANVYERPSSLGGSRASQHGRKQEEYFPAPLPLVPLKPRSDWADDERDTSHGFTDRSRDHGFSRNDAYLDRDFDMPRVSLLPQKHAHNFDKRRQWDNETREASSGEVSKLDSYVRTASRAGREGSSWRNSSFRKDGFGVQDAANERNGAQPSTMNTDLGHDNKYVPSRFRDAAAHDYPGKMDMGYGQGGKHPWNNSIESYGGRPSEQNVRDRVVGCEQQSGNRVDSVQSSVSRSSFSLGGKGLPVREKCPLPKSEKSFLVDPFTKIFGASGFDGGDIFSAGLVGVVKKKKNALKQIDLHDPVRESFEAELERVQRMQEQERQKIIEKQEMAMEFARREEEERLKQAREQERKMRLEEEAREAVCRAEQEHIESLRKAEELRLSREEDKRRIDLEEERRKQAAKQKLLELEQRIARRQAEAVKGCAHSPIPVDESIPGFLKENDSSRATDMSNWDDNEKMVERIITSASSDSPSVNRPLDTGYRPHFSRDISSNLVDRGNTVNSWRNIYENGSSHAPYLQEHDNGNNCYGPHRDSSIVRKPLMRKDYCGGAGLMSSRNHNKGGISDSHLDEHAHLHGQRWNQSGVGDHFSRNTEIDSDFHENFVDRFGDGWSQSRSSSNSFPPYPECSHPKSESDGPYTNLGRSRYSVRQPRVLPPPTLASMPRTHRSRNEYSGPSAFLDNEIRYDQAASGGSIIPTEVVDAMQETTDNKDHEVETASRCGSQSSLSVSSPPSSPTHLSHDDLDGSGDSPVILISEESKNDALSALENESIVTSVRAHNVDAVASSSAVSPADDEEWTTENNEHFQEQEEYDEDEDYQEEDEVHDNNDLNQEFEDMHLEEKRSPHMMDNLVLGFNEGVQVGMPNVEFERASKDEETTFIAPQDSMNTLDEHVSFDNACGDGETSQPVYDSCQMNLNTSSSVFEDSKKPTNDLVIQPINVNPCLESGSAGNVGPTISTSGTIAPHSSVSPNVMSNVAASSQAELPIKLQFGLFSGPSLIPSPVPSIQIGSIQMPLPLQPPVGAPYSHMHPSQSPLFQFGQLRYASPISQGLMPLGPQTMSFVQSNIASELSFNHNHGGQMSVQDGPDTSDRFVKNETRSYSLDNQPGISRHLSQGSLPCENAENIDGLKQGTNSTRTATGFRVDKRRSQNSLGNSSSAANESNGQPLARDTSIQLVPEEDEFMYSKAHHPLSGGRGKRHVFSVKTPGSRSSDPAGINHSDSRGFLRRPRRNIQHTEFRVRETAKSQSSSLVLFGQFGSDNNSNINGMDTGISGRTGPRKTSAKNLRKQTVKSATENSQHIDSGSRADKVDGKGSTKIQSTSHLGHSNLKRTLNSGEDVDAPLQSGIIRVFEQPGIEAPSDEDDFIEVRSKRQMLNDRREQRERESKAKSQSAKMPRKSRSTSQNAAASANYSGGSISTVEMANRVGAHLVAEEGHRMAKIDASSGFDSSLSSQPLAPIGTPPLKIGAHSDIRSQTSRPLKTSLPVVLGGGKGSGTGVDAQTSLGSWGNVQISHSQQVMTLTQTQLDEAMKPQQFDSRGSLGDLKSSVNDSSLPTSSILTKEKAFASGSSPINSLLAGEKIQFGAVTSPTVLTSSRRSVSHDIGPGRSSRSDLQFSHNLDGSENDSSLFFDKEKHDHKSHGQLEDCEAEAAASAVAVAAISNDENVGNGLSTCSSSVSDAKCFVATNIAGEFSLIRASSEQQSITESRSGEPLSVSLPADLSLDTPPISFWSPLQNQHNLSSQMISHFPAGPPQFPFYEMNPMMSGRPVFAFGPHDESAAAAQSQPQNSNTPASGPTGSWHQCHSGVDSFYGPPTGFSGPFITPPGGIPGVQGPPHMVVYNHFAPVGQFGQVGLSFMGTTYIPTGKQPDWKHNPTSSAMGSEGDSNVNMVTSLGNPTNMPSPIHHLAPGSLLPMHSPRTMFNVSPFQSPEMTVQAPWPHIPNSQVPSIPPQSVPSLQQGVHTSLYSHVPSVEQPLNSNRFTSSQISTSDVGRNYLTASNANVNQLPDELGLVDHSYSTACNITAQSVVNKIQSVNANVQNDNGGNSNNQNSNYAFKNHPSQKNNMPTQQCDHSSGYINQRRGNVSCRHNASGGEWSHRKMGFHGRNQSLGADKSKVKQIYVAKQSTGGASKMS
ncbi:hypothetical protein Lal_00026202 [Lupinus albus]|uniref:Uncharacterized protein n=1 Tax=Lupinus albus TaxID=3870 RepID=A0A6A4PYW1_LUPAL|nr:putative protein WYRD [Lupinus albus]KAF1861763.1 hypothetical protein Lal_00026202 [Lupinus albus]